MDRLQANACDGSRLAEAESCGSAAWSRRWVSGCHELSGCEVYDPFLAVWFTLKHALALFVPPCPKGRQPRRVQSAISESIDLQGSLPRRVLGYYGGAVEYRQRTGAVAAGGYRELLFDAAPAGGPRAGVKTGRK